MLKFFSRSQRVEPVPVESWEARRRREIPAELNRLTAELEATELAIEKFWGGPDLRMRVLRDRSACAFVIENHERLRQLDGQRDSLLRSRAKLLDERASLEVKR